MRLDLRSLDVVVGGSRSLDLRVPVEDFTLAGQTYRAEPSTPSVHLDIVGSIGGLHLRLRSQVALVGPCWRCLEESATFITVDATEFAGDASAATPGDEGDGGLESEYVVGDDLELDQWLRDAIAEAVPPRILCGVEGCSEPVSSLGESAAGVDPRWAPLEALAERLRAES